jgi:CRP-like cAMP-binding protein
MNTNQMTAWLRTVELFNQLDKNQVEEIARLGVWKTRAAGKRVFSQGRPIRRLYFIVSGSVRVFNETEEGTEESLTIFSRGEFLNEIVLLYNTAQHTASAEVYADMS